MFYEMRLLWGDKEQMDLASRLLLGKTGIIMGSWQPLGYKQINKNCPFPKQLQIVEDKNHLGIIRLVFWLFNYLVIIKSLIPGVKAQNHTFLY